jgi:hypothetical protein
MTTLRDPFNPKTGIFAKNIRSTTDDDLAELTDSMKEFGWIPELPALIDERQTDACPCLQGLALSKCCISRL